VVVKTLRGFSLYGYVRRCVGTALAVCMQ
jgi:hypothetical protein